MAIKTDALVSRASRLLETGSLDALYLTASPEAHKKALAKGDAIVAVQPGNKGRHRVVYFAVEGGPTRVVESPKDLAQVLRSYLSDLSDLADRRRQGRGGTEDEHDGDNDERSHGENRDLFATFWTKNWEVSKRGSAVVTGAEAPLKVRLGDGKDKAKGIRDGDVFFMIAIGLGLALVLALVSLGLSARK